MKTIPPEVQSLAADLAGRIPYLAQDSALNNADYLARRILEVLPAPPKRRAHRRRRL